MINKIYNWVFKKEKIELTYLNSSQIKKVLPKINYKILNPAKYYLLDEDYKSCTLTDFKKILKKDFTNWKTANKDYDCDNFAFKLNQNIKDKYPVMSFGIVFSNSHAFNVFIDKFGKAWYVEPQNDKVFSFVQLNKQYKPIQLVII